MDNDGGRSHGVQLDRVYTLHVEVRYTATHDRSVTCNHGFSQFHSRCAIRRNALRESTGTQLRVSARCNSTLRKEGRRKKHVIIYVFIALGE